jgi:hypothetical protein
VSSDGIDGVDDSLIFPDGLGTVVVALDKESLLARLTADQRSGRKQAVVDRFFRLSGPRAHYVTDTYVVAEVVSAFRSARGAQEAVELYRDIQASELIVQHGPDSWDTTQLSQSSREVLDAAAVFLNRYSKHDVSLQEAVLVLQAKRNDAQLFSFDGPIRRLGRSCNLDVLPMAASVYIE